MDIIQRYRNRIDYEAFVCLSTYRIEVVYRYQTAIGISIPRRILPGTRYVYIINIYICICINCCEIEDFVEAPLCMLCVIRSHARTTRMVFFFFNQWKLSFFFCGPIPLFTPKWWLHPIFERFLVVPRWRGWVLPAKVNWPGFHRTGNRGNYSFPVLGHTKRNGSRNDLLLRFFLLSFLRGTVTGCSCSKTRQTGTSGRGFCSACPCCWCLSYGEINRPYR